MKKSDIAMIILIASVSVVVAFFVASSVPFLQVSEQGAKVDTVDKIPDSIDEPDTAVFNENAINPAVETIIGGQGQSTGQR